MVLYTCQNCLKEFNKKCNYTSHLNRKYICKKKEVKKEEIPKMGSLSQNKDNIETNDKNTNTCSYCSKTYKHKCHLNRHLKNCKVKKEEELKQQLFDLLIKEQNKKMDEQNLYMNQQINLLQKQLKVKK